MNLKTTHWRDIIQNSASGFFLVALSASMLITGCLFATRALPPETEFKTWHFLGISQKLGRLTSEGKVDFTLGDTTVISGERVLHEKSPSGEQNQYFPEGRECYYSVKWDGPIHCYSDDKWIFFEDGRISLNFGSTLCDIAGPESLAGHWSFNSSNSEMTMKFHGDEEIFQIEALGDSLKVLSQVASETDACGGRVYIKSLYTLGLR